MRLMGMSGDALGEGGRYALGEYDHEEMAIEAVKGEKLGKGADTDFWRSAFSSPDEDRASWGPQSNGATGRLLRADREFADLFSFWTAG